MRLVSFEGGFGRVDGTNVVPMGADLLDYLTGVDLGSDGSAIPLERVHLLAPVPRPGKVICVGLNYRDHAAEVDMAPTSEPVLFAKFANSVIASGDTIVLPAESDQVDFEAELAVVIGRRARGVSEDGAMEYVAGYACANDVSARDLQFRTGQWLLGKAVDTFLPLGPWLVTPDEVGDPSQLEVSCTVNGRLMQHASTADMIFSIPQIVSYISQTITLEPGDVIATGTPPGVGFSRTPPVFLQDGDVVVVTVERVGTLKNSARRG